MVGGFGPSLMSSLPGPDSSRRGHTLATSGLMVGMQAMTMGTFISMVYQYAIMTPAKGGSNSRLEKSR